MARDFGEWGIFKGEVERVEEERKRFYYNITVVRDKLSKANYDYG